MARSTLRSGTPAHVDAGKTPRTERTAETFLRWTYMRAAFHRGYVLVSSLYFVVTAHLSAFQLLVLGAAMAVTMVLSDVPGGVLSDAFSRKWPLVIDTGSWPPAW